MVNTILVNNMNKILKIFTPNIYKDMVFGFICTVWLIGNTIEYINTDCCFFSNNFMIILMCIIILFKIYSIDFNNWLNTKIYV